MKILFRDHELQDLANGIGDHKYPTGIAKKYRFVIQKLSAMDKIKEIREYHGWKAERKKGDRIDQIGIRLNNQRRLLLKAEGGEITVLLIRELSKHYE